MPGSNDGSPPRRPEMQPIIRNNEHGNNNNDDDNNSVGTSLAGSFRGGVLEDFVSDDDEVGKRRNRKPWLTALSIIVLVVCVVTLAAGLYIGLTRNRTEVNTADGRNDGGSSEEPPAGSSSDKGTNTTTTTTNTTTEGESQSEDLVGTNETASDLNHKNGTEGSSETDILTALGMRSINAAGIIQNGRFRALESHPLPNATIPVFGQSLMTKFSDCKALEDELYNALSIITNEVIMSHATSDSQSYYMMDEDMVMTTTTEAEADTTNFKEAGGGAEAGAGAEDSYETNNQVQGIDEADVVKSTADHVFAAYGDKLVVWNATSGEKYSVTKLKKLQKQSTKKMVAPGMGQSVTIRSLLLHDNRLVVIVDGLDEEQNGWEYSRIFHTYQGPSRVLVYDLSKIPTDGSRLPLMAARDLGGRYTDARMIGSVAHLVSMANVNTYTHLRRHFSRYEKRFSDMNSTEYVQNATAYATSIIIPSFIQRMVDEIMERDITCEDIMKISLLRTSDEDQSVPEVGPLLDGYVQVDSFDILSVPNTTQVGFVQANVTGSFAPSSYDATIYASGDTLVIANKGYHYDSATKGWKQNTFITSFSYDTSNGGVGVIPKGSAEVPGYIMNQYSLDIWDGHLRMASTIGSRWGCQASDDEETTCKWTMLEDSDNFVSIYKLPNNQTSDLTLVGSLNDLGEVGERIEAVRFMGDKAFIVTFLRTDPFYTIDLRNSSSPRVHGELKITGFSNYLHPYDADGDFIIGIGQDANQDGMPTGLQISLFNATDLSNTTLVQRYNVQESLQSFSSSAAQYDPKAFRFLPIAKKLIIPSKIGYPGSVNGFFDGFQVFDVSPFGIEYSFNVSHVVEDGNRVDAEEIDGINGIEPAVTSWCWYSAYLQPRSLVHKGILTTIKGHTVLATDLYTRIRQWELNLDSDNNDCSNDGYWSIAVPSVTSNSEVNVGMGVGVDVTPSKPMPII